MSFKVGFVIPIIHTGYLEGCLKNLHLPHWATAVVVNDGTKDIVDEVNELCKTYSVFPLHLKENMGFAKANNNGWKWLEKEFNPKYVGTLNSDTIPEKGWIEALVESIEKNNVSMALPRQKLPNKRIIDWYELRELSTTWKCAKITDDILVTSLSGFCFLSRLDHLKNVGFFDENYLNGTEDFDLALSFKEKDYRICVSYKSVVFHYCGRSRWRKGTNTNTGRNKLYFRKKWEKRIKGG